MICMAHRGWSSKAPENTLAAIQLALMEPKVTWIEIDVQLSKDGIPVVIHDFTLERTTNGVGPVHDLTLQQLQRLDAGSWFSPVFIDERIPSLSEVLHAVKGRCKLNIELKTAGDLYPSLAEKVVALIQEMNMEQEVVITSFDHEKIRRIKERNTNIQTGLIIWGKPTLLKEQLKETGATILSMAFPFLTQEFIEEMKKEEITIFAWTVDEEDHMKAVLQQDPSIYICTNYPDRLFNVNNLAIT
ncbi:glycerophosphodiester phosphodiesterase [Bacillus salitolerans]|uniref:Glycerophosphodiester phosphodiesterase n=1 Tax=Bacillus salitolerans TaxID=1437434 RepID=A0ABW4LUY8_9BACI